MASSQQLPPELERLNRIYIETCEAFDSGEISAEKARSTVLGLSATDSQGRIWVIDPKKSGRRASFKRSENTPPLATPPQVTQPIPVIEPSPIAEVEKESEIHEPEPIISRRSFLSDLSGKSIALGVLSAGVVYEVAKLFSNESGNSDSANNSSIDASGSDSANDPAWFNTFGEVPFNVDIEFGRSVQNVPLTFYRRQSGENGARVLVVGCIHGDEFVGNRVIDILRDLPLEGNIDLWTVRTINPDGQQLRTRQNANGVDLNRNFPGNWRKIGKPGSWQYAGTGPASEPEVAAIVKLGELVQPEFVIWYHQDYFRIGPGTGHDGQVRAKYAELVGLPLLELDCLCGYTGDKPLLEAVFGGTGANWAKSFQGPQGVSMTVEFGPTLSEEDAQRNASAVVSVTNEFF